MHTVSFGIFNGMLQTPLIPPWRISRKEIRFFFFECSPVFIKREHRRGVRKIATNKKAISEMVTAIGRWPISMALIPIASAKGSLRFVSLT